MTAPRSQEATLSRLLAVVRELAYLRDTAGIAEVVRQAVRDILRCDGATFILREGEMVFYADEDAIGPLWKGKRFPIDRCLSGWAILNKAHAAVPDIYKDDRVPIEAYRSTFVKSVLMMPMRIDEPVGAIGAYWAKSHKPTAEEIGALRTIADAAAIGFANRQLFEQVQTLNRELERMVEERTAKLRDALSQLEAFNYSIAHDLRAPLRHVVTYSELAAHRAGARLDPGARELLERGAEAARKLERMISDLLQYSRTGRDDLKPCPVDLSSVFAEVVEQLGPELKERGGRVKVEQLPHVSAHPVAVKQIASNLIGNAIKFVPADRTPEARVRAETRDGKVRVWVEDNGIGIDESGRGGLFRIFNRLNPDFPGTGIGLAIVRRAAERFGGACGVESEPGRGSRFWFELPAADPKERAVNVH